MEAGKQFRAIMAGFGDEAKPMWGTCLESASAEEIKVLDGKQLEDLRGCLQANDGTGLYQKIIACQLQSPTSDSVDFGLVRHDMTVRPAYTWLRDKQVNKAILSQPRLTSDVFVHTDTPMTPIGYEYRQKHDGIEILKVVVDSLVPMRITLMPSSEPRNKPAGKPAPAKPKTGEPNSYDI